MATDQGMSGIDTRAVVAELKDKLPLWVDRIYQFDTRTLGIRFNGEGHTRHQFIIEAGRRAHLTRELPKPPKNPPPFAMLLRKYLYGGRVLAIRQQGLERIIIFDIGKRDSTYRLIIELFDDGNIILTDEQYTIIQPLRRHRFKKRDVIAGVPYALSESDPTASQESLARFLKADDRDLVRALAVGCMLGGAYAEYICRIAGVEKNVSAQSADPAKIYSALHELFEAVIHARTPTVSSNGCNPVNIFKPGTAQHFPTFNEALDVFYPKTGSETTQPAAKQKAKKEDVIRRHQQDAIKKFGDKIARSERIIAAIYENYSLVTDVIAFLFATSRTHSWQEIAETLKNNRSGGAIKIVAVYPERATVDLDLGERVTIDVREGLEQNVSRYYAEIKKFKKKKAGAIAAMERPVKRERTTKRQIVPLKKQWYHRFRWFMTSDDVVVLGGRDAYQNEELVKKYLSGNDLFVHADVHGASVVIVKGTTGKMDEVAQFAASYSGAWRSGHFSADVYTARPDQVSKTPESGEYVSRGSFIVRGERTYYRSVPLSVAIGFQTEPQVSVIGGPPSAIRIRTKAYVELKPGKFEPNDVAKMVLRLLKQKLPGDEVKGLKGILNTEAVAAFVPSGGSDIVGEHEG